MSILFLIDRHCQIVPSCLAVHLPGVDIDAKLGEQQGDQLIVALPLCWHQTGGFEKFFSAVRISSYLEGSPCLFQSALLQLSRSSWFSVFSSQWLIKTSEKYWALEHILVWFGNSFTLAGTVWCNVTHWMVLPNLKGRVLLFATMFCLNISLEHLSRIQKCLALEGVDTSIGCALNFQIIPNKHLCLYWTEKLHLPSWQTPDQLGTVRTRQQWWDKSTR